MIFFVWPIAGVKAQSYAVATCSSGSDTTITGTVFDPAGKNPLPNILVYVPQSAVSSLTDGVNTSSPTKDNYATLVTGNPLVEVTTSANGTFSLSGVPAGTGVPLVIQAGRWRRQFVINTVTACATTQLYSTAVTTVGTDPSDLSSSNLTQGGSSSLSGYGEYTSLRFARNQNEGDIPKIAFVTGGSDALECSLRKIGIDDAEFSDSTVGINSTSGNTAVSSSSPVGRIGLYQRSLNGGAMAPEYAGATTSVSTVQSGYTLFGSTATLDGYNVLMLPCDGDDDSTLETGGSNLAYAQNVAAFTSAGGRIFATHYSSDLLNSVSSISGAANWVSPTSAPSNSGTATINASSTDSQVMGEWLYGMNAGTEYQVGVSNLRISQTGTNAPTVNWATIPNANWTYGSTAIADPVLEFSYYTPFTATTTDDQYGRVFFTDYHVNNGTGSSYVFPAECTSSMAKTYAMTPQEEMLEYSLFQLMNFAIPQFTPSVNMTVTATPATLISGDSNDTLSFTLTNTSSAQAITLDAPVTLTLTLPAGVTATSASGTGWNCTTASSTATCTLTSTVAANASSTLDVNVAVDSSVTTGSKSIAATLSSKEFSSNPSLSVTVNTSSAVSTSTTLAVSLSSINYGDSETLTATVSSNNGTPTGSVSFYDGATLLGTATLSSSGVASLTDSVLAVGSHSITAVYSSNSPWTTSTSAASSVTVAAAATTTTLTVAPNPVTLGNAVLLSATVAADNSTPSGTVSFYDGSTLLGSATLDSKGVASLSNSALQVGAHNITAVYSAGTSWATSTSNAVPLAVNQLGTSTVVVSSANSVMYGTAVTFTATVSASTGAPTGTVTFYDGTTSLGSATLTNGSASIATSTLSSGVHSITAVYGGVTNYAVSTSPILSETVIDLGVTVAGGSGNSGSSSSSTTVTTTTGGNASVLLSLTSNQSTILPVDSTLTVTGQPAGTSISLTGSNWQVVSSANWLYPKGYTLVNPTLTFALPSQLASADHSTAPLVRHSAPLLLGMLLLPFARRMRKAGRKLLLLVIMVFSLAGVFGVTGCAAHNGFYATKSYNVTITLTAGSVTKVSYVTLNVN